MIVGRRLSRFQDCRRSGCGLGSALSFIGFAFALHGFELRTVRRFFRWSERAPNVGPPTLLDASAPVAETSSGATVAMNDIPTSVVASLAVACKAMQLAVGYDPVVRLQAGG